MNKYEELIIKIREVLAVLKEKQDKNNASIKEIEQELKKLAYQESQLESELYFKETNMLDIEKKKMAVKKGYNNYISLAMLIAAIIALLGLLSKANWLATTVASLGFSTIISYSVYKIKSLNMDVDLAFYDKEDYEEEIEKTLEKQQKTYEKSRALQEKKQNLLDENMSLSFDINYFENAISNIEYAESLLTQLLDNNVEEINKTYAQDERVENVLTRIKKD